MSADLDEPVICLIKVDVDQNRDPVTWVPSTGDCKKKKCRCKSMMKISTRRKEMSWCECLVLSCTVVPTYLLSLSLY